MTHNIGDACVNCHFSRSIHRQTEHERGKVTCVRHNFIVAANGLCDMYVAGTYHISRTGVAVRVSWRESVARAKARTNVVPAVAPVLTVKEVPLDLF